MENRSKGQLIKMFKSKKKSYEKGCFGMIIQPFANESFMGKQGVDLKEYIIRRPNTPNAYKATLAMQETGAKI